MDGKSLDITADRLDHLKSIFPEVFTEGKIDFTKLRAILGDTVVKDDQFYGLSWAGKYESFKEIQKQTTATLIPDRENSIDFDNAQNIFIEGENLETLRVLQKSYYGKIKLIYIDPPYNTGNDSFVYPDDYSERLDEFKKRTGIVNNEGFLNKQDLWKKNSKENGQFHSVWLSMMYPRLYLAKNLLRNDGVIFISIDDNEAHNLKLLLDEIFGSENFIADIIWNGKYTVANDVKYVSYQHEHLLFYAKNKDNFEIGLLDRTDEMNNAYSNPDNDKKGAWKSTPLHAKSGNSTYSITFPNNVTWSPPKGTYPRYSKETLNRMFNEGKIHFGKDGKSIPSGKTYLSEVKQGKTVGSVWNFKDVGSSHQGNDQLSSILGKGVFDNPKPTQLIINCCKVANTKDDDIILDFFAGSGTTAQAVVELNLQDNQNRRFICVQLPEKCDSDSEAFKSGYNTISKITNARISKFFEKIRSKDNLGLYKNTILGYKSFILVNTNFNIWEINSNDPNNLITQLQLNINPLKSKLDSKENIVYELLIKSGLDLNSLITTKTINDDLFYILGKNEYLIAVSSFHFESLNYILELKPTIVICLDSIFKGNDNLKTNVYLTIKESGIQLKSI